MIFVSVIFCVTAYGLKVNLTFNLNLTNCVIVTCVNSFDTNLFIADYRSIIQESHFVSKEIK
jgi:hypothetical protein